MSESVAPPLARKSQCSLLGQALTALVVCRIVGDPAGPVPANELLRRDVGWVPASPFDAGLER